MTASTLLPRSTSARRRASRVIRRSTARISGIPYPSPARRSSSAWSSAGSPLGDALDQPAEVAALAVRAESIDHIVLERLGPLGRGVEKEGKFVELQRQDRAIGAAGLGDPARDVGPDDQPALARHVEHQPVGIAPSGA